MPPPDLPLFLRLARLIDFAGTLAVAATAGRAFLLAARRDLPGARRAVAGGAVAGLSFKTAGTGLVFIGLHSWESIGMFAALLTLRLALKQVFVAELDFRGGGTDRKRA